MISQDQQPVDESGTLAQANATPDSGTSRLGTGYLLWAVFKTAALGAVLCAAIGILVWGVQMNSRISATFGDSLSAQKGLVYAQPLSLYRNQVLTSRKLVTVLDDLGYREVDEPRDPGTYRLQVQSPGYSKVELVTRPFSHLRDTSDPQHLVLGFRGQHLVQATRADGTDVTQAVTLDPKLLGSVASANNKDSRPLPIEAIPQGLIDSLIAVEDRSFFRHFGIDLKGIARAAWANVEAGRIEQGASTITQQLVRSHFLDRDRNFVRKANEAMMAMLLEFRYSKEQILEGYINEVYLGQSGSRAIHGFGLASQFYFGRPLGELSIDQMALLVGMVRGPSLYNPRRNGERSRKRRDVVLRKLGDHNDVYSKQAMNIARQSPLGVTPNSPGVGNTFAFDNYVRKQLDERYEDAIDRRQNLTVFSTLDPIIQSDTEQAVVDGLREIETLSLAGDDPIEPGKLEAAVVVVGVKDGQVRAIVGGRDTGFAGFNRALDARRPIGSLVKPAIFLTALENTERYALNSKVEDSRFQIPARNGRVWRPNNFTGREHGKVTLLRALASSYNLAAARLGLDVGVDSVNETINRLGVPTAPDPYPSLLLGALELTPLEVAQMYQTMANGGRRIPIHPVIAIRQEGDSKLIPAPITEEVISERDPSRRIVRAMQEVMTTGTGRSIAADFSNTLKLAGKTGTTDNLRDSWFAGFSGNYLTVVWVGRDDNQPAGVTGASGALKVWTRVMRSLSLEPVKHGDKVVTRQKRMIATQKEAHCDETRLTATHPKDMSCTMTLAQDKNTKTLHAAKVPRSTPSESNDTSAAKDALTQTRAAGG